ncbi:unnamed protein product [Polarella glacialis]|uniref:Carboxylic ester hydrolase n=3 Tax=Polarella glacialis TaxID=89957 RepID=A0A813GVN0_POLGL|nr:unnamed protein product [Polarella glacialis]
MNGIFDNVVALRWLQKYVSHFGGDPGQVTIFGQSSGAYSLCTLCVAPDARGLFKRAGLLSGPCFGGPASRGWGPRSAELGRNVSEQILAAHGSGRDLASLRGLPAENVQWPAEWLSDLTKAPSFSGYFEDTAVLPLPADELWRRGAIVPEEVMVSCTSKDGTGAFYGLAPTLGLIGPDENTNTSGGYDSKMRAAWGADAEDVLRQYPLTDYPSAPAAFIQADADAYVICPSRRVARYAARAGRRVWVAEFAHFQPSPSQPMGCSGYGPQGCQGFGCDNGVELDVVPGRHVTHQTELWASHGGDVKFVFGTETGPDGLGPPSNLSHCEFDADERQLSRTVMAHWAAFARHGNPNAGLALEQLSWPSAEVRADGQVDISRMRFSVEATDGALTGLRAGMHDHNCDFWDTLYPEGPLDAAKVIQEPRVAGFTEWV